MSKVCFINLSHLYSSTVVVSHTKYNIYNIQLYKQKYLYALYFHKTVIIMTKFH